MEFWGVEVKPGETLKVNPGEGKYLHLSQASLGEVKNVKAAENVPTFVKFDNQKLVLGTLSAEKYPQIQYDLVFEKEFELSHNSKNTSVFFAGYKTMAMEDGFDQFSDESDSESDEDVPAAVPLSKNENGKPAVKVEEPKVQNALKENATAAAKSKPKLEDPAKAAKPKVEEVDDDDDEDDEDDDDSEEDDSDDDEEMAEGEDDSDDEEDDSSDEDEATPVKAQAGDKRPLGSTTKTPVADKKAKLVSPAGQKAGGSNKKQGHTATPHPAKHAGKTPANDKSKQQTPKSAGSVTCKSCSKTFNSDVALQSHTKAKHVAK